MANLGRMLGLLLATRMAGRGRFGTALGSAALLRGGRLGRTAGLASLGYMAFRAWQDRQTREPDAREPAAGAGLAEAGGSFSGGGAEGGFDDGRALLLIRAMIAAANADGRISPEERRRIVAEVDAAGGDGDDHALIERELDEPRPLEKLLAQVHDHDTAQQFYAASRAAMNDESPAQTAYLNYLRHRLDLPQDETAEIEEAMR